MKEITVQELKTMIDENEPHQLIDVREPHEFDIANIGGKLIPMGEVIDNIDSISKDKKVVLHCRNGTRSRSVVIALKQHGFDNLYNLKGGILAWTDDIDPSLTKY